MEGDEGGKEGSDTHQLNQILHSIHNIACCVAGTLGQD